jgi:hypothetical protein
MVYILRNTKLMHKFCTQFNKATGCREAFGCGIACPLAMLQAVESNLGKGMEFSKAFRTPWFESLSKGEMLAILRDASLHDKEYPTQDKLSIVKEILSKMVSELAPAPSVSPA